MTDYDGEPDEHRFQRVDRDAQERRLAERERATKAMTLPEFLLARIADDEAAARAALDRGFGGWEDFADMGANHEERSHITRWHPARVLAECAAKRRIVGMFTPSEPPPATDAEAHARRAHPAYEYATTEGQRKSWDTEDEPPKGDGWERNVDAGRNGWERFDYTEEAYWRRLRPGALRERTERAPLRALASVYAGHPDYREEWAP